MVTLTLLYFLDGSSNSVVISLVTPQSYVIDIVGASATVYHISGFISDVSVPTIADAVILVNNSWLLKTLGEGFRPLLILTWRIYNEY